MADFRNDGSNVADRLDRLERQYRRWRLAAISGAAVIVAALLMGQSPPTSQPVEGNVVTGQRFVLVDGAGRQRGVWAVGPSGQPGLLLYDNKERVRLAVAVSPDGTPIFTMRDGEEHIRAGMTVGTNGGGGFNCSTSSDGRIGRRPDARRRECTMNARIVAIATCLAVGAGSVQAADNELTAQEKKDGWLLLFDGKTLNGWMTCERQPSKTPVDHGAINPHQCGGYLLMHEKVWADFELQLDFKIPPRCNSGIFLRTYSLIPRPGWDVAYNGLEIAIDDTKTAGYHDTGAIYDLVAPSKNAMKPPGQWNHVHVVCNRNRITVELNGEKVTRMDLDRFSKPSLRPDGTTHKFTGIAYKNFPRYGYIGLQDHGSPCWYKNIKLRPLKPARKGPSTTTTKPVAK